MPGKQVHLRPKKKTMKLLVSKMFMLSLGRGFQAAAALDDEIKKEIAFWPDGFTIMMKVKPFGPCMVMIKKNGLLKYAGGAARPDADLIISFKNLESGFMVLTGMMGTPQAYCEHRTSVKGNLAEAMRLIRCLENVLAYLFPEILSKRLLKRVPNLTPKRLLNRGIIYAIGIPFGRP